MRIQPLPARQQSLCIFCAARIAQRRTFHARSPNDQQATAAAPSKEQEPDESHTRPIPTRTAANGSNWGPAGGGWDSPNQPQWSSSTIQGGQGSSLSAEEQRIRQNLSDRAAAKASESNGSRAPPPARRPAAQRQWSMGRPNAMPAEPTASNAQTRTRPQVQSGTTNDGVGRPTGIQSPASPLFRVVMHGNASEQFQQPASSREQALWAHLKRRNAQVGDHPNRVGSTPAGIPTFQTQGAGPATEDEYSRNSRIRREQSKTGRFVGFEPRTNVRCHQCGQLGHLKPECPQLRHGFGSPSTAWGQTDADTTMNRGAPLRTIPTSILQQTGASDGLPPKTDGARGTTSATPPPDRQRDTGGGPREDLQLRNERETPTRKVDRFARSDEQSKTSVDSPPKRRDDQKRKARNLLYAREAAMLREEEKERAERRKAKDLRKAQRLQAAQQMKQVAIPPFISIGHLATLLDVRSAQFERSLKRLGFTEVNHDHVLNAEDASLIAQEYEFTPIVESSTQNVDLHPAPEPEDKAALPPRPPVVTIMGHVDHGKTTILDYLRKSSIAASEHGGITQHIGAFNVPMASGRTITFLDTPGHAAFLTMRQRGANVTDIVVLVVAADDSVMPQTLESIKCAKTAGVPMIVAINKMDKADAEPERVKQDLARYGVELEDFGGDTQVVYVSGKTGLGMEDLEESISTLSEILDQRADPTGVVEGWILEASTKKSGRVATILVRRGTLKVGDIIVAGMTWARVRSMRNEFGTLVESVGPGMPVEIDGWRDQPAAGDEVLEATDEQQAAAVTEYRADAAEQVKAAKDMEAINLARRLEAERRAAEAAAEAGEADNTGEEGATPSQATTADTSRGPQIVHFIVKGDVSGSVEAVINQVSAIGNAEIRPVILHSAVGPINQSDVERAALADGYIIAFNTTSEPGVQGQAERAGVGLIEHSIIYRVTDDIKALLESKLPPEIITKVTGEADIAQPFSINVEKRKFVRIAGSKVKNGTITNRSKVKVLRAGEVIYTGLVSSLRNKKQAAQEMKKGSECGIGFDGWEGFEAGDQIQCFEEVEKRRTL